MMRLERLSASSAHWTETQYDELFSAVSAPERLVLVGEDTMYFSGPADALESGVAMVGFLVARHVAAEWELENIVVDSMARNRGLGRQLLNALLDAARETNSEVVFLEVRESNAAARALYEKAGFEHSGWRKAYYNDPPDHAVLYRWKSS